MEMMRKRDGEGMRRRGKAGIIGENQEKSKVRGQEGEGKGKRQRRGDIGNGNISGISH